MLLAPNFLRISNMISFLLRRVELKKSQVKKMTSSIFRYILEITFFERSIGLLCGNCLLIQSNLKVLSTPLSHQDESNDIQLDIVLASSTLI